MRVIGAFALALWIGGPSGSALAADGRIELSQVSALAGGVTPGDQPGFPVTLSLPGSYLVTTDLVVPDENTTAIRITGADVTLDLGGHRLFGPNSCVPGENSCLFSGSGAGVDASSPAGAVRIRNGTIWGMGGGGIVAGDDARIDAVRIFHNGDVGLIAGNSSRITRVLVEENGYGIWLGSGRLSHSVVRANLLYGITVLSQASLLQNTASGNGGPGIAATFASVLVSNVARNNTGDGIRSAGLLRGNVAEGNGRCGIVATNHALVFGNATAHNARAGIHFRSGVIAYRSNVVSDLVPVTTSGSPANLGGNLCASCVPVSDPTCDLENP